jgi:uncharacterized cupredoxin-like copper-binding protein
MSKLVLTAATAAFLAISSPAFAAGTHGGGHGAKQAGHGAPGEASAATRTIEIIMKDNFYEPEEIEVSAGETIRFVIVNAGDLVHEFNIGTAATHEEHMPMMQMMVDHGVLEPSKINHDVAKSMQASMGHGMHDEPNSVLLEPGKSGEIIWTFPESGEIEFACNVPGHYDGGMVIETSIKGAH